MSTHFSRLGGRVDEADRMLTFCRNSFLTPIGDFMNDNTMTTFDPDAKTLHWYVIWNFIPHSISTLLQVSCEDTKLRLTPIFQGSSQTSIPISTSGGSLVLRVSQSVLRNTIPRIFVAIHFFHYATQRVFDWVDSISSIQLSNMSINIGIIQRLRFEPFEF